MVQKISIDELPRALAGYSRLVCRISFEARSISVANSLFGKIGESVVAFASRKRREPANKNLAIFRGQYDNATITELDTSDPLETVDKIFDTISRAVSKTALDDTLIDITSFRREELLMLLAVLRQANLPSDTNCQLLYVSADTMSEWMSGQVTGHRSVIGYAGEIWPSRSTRLVILMGFEHARASSIIENYEPKFLVLGKAPRAESISDQLSSLNERFFRELRSQYENVDMTFEFSARDPLKVAEQLEEAVVLDDNSNVIIAPLHTKLSTIGAGLYAQRHKKVQVCYAPVAEYNEAAYSTPGRDVYLVPLKDLL